MDNCTLEQHLHYRIPQIRLALIKEPDTEPAEPIKTPDDMDRFVKPLRYCSEEYFIAFHLNAKLQVIGYHEVSHGTLSASLVHPREVFKAAILNNAHSIIVAHNHPAGSLTPSDEDIETTKVLIRAGSLMNVAVVDHVIVATDGLCSLREAQPWLWNK